MTSQNDIFRTRLSQMVQETKSDIDLVVRSIALQILKSVVEKSPVDTGRFRGNWFVQQDISPALREGTDENGEATVAAGAEEIARFHVGGTLYILNHLPYAIPLEYGHSQKQAPLGMVRITIEEFQAYIESAVAEVKK